MSGAARGTGWVSAILALMLFGIAQADTTNNPPAAPPATNAAPLSSFFLAPPPLTSTKPEAPEVKGVSTPNPEPAPDAAAPATEKTPAPVPAAEEEPKFSVPLPAPFNDPAGKPDELAAHLLVVYNAKDPDSESLARYYAKRRAIPAERVFALNCPTREEITRGEFDKTIREPLIDLLLRQDWMERSSQTIRLGDRSFDLLVARRNDIWAIVLMRGVPLKIMDSVSEERGMQPQDNLKTNAAAVDNELALLPVFGFPIGGFVPNPFFDVHNTGEVRAGPELATKIIMVTRLDGPSVGDVRRMIDDCLAAENDRLAGSAVIDSRGFVDVKNGYTEGDVWLRKSRDLLAADGWPVLFDDQPVTLPATEPLNDVALYLGWYTPTANGPWVTPPNRFVRGAIAYHLHSFSGWTVRSTAQNWVGPLIDHGADATMGNVYEPYLALTPHLDIFTRRLLDGDSFAESAYASELALSWMTTVVGDPLYHPFRKPLEQAIADAPPGTHRDWLRLQLLERQLDAHPPASADALARAFDLPNAGPVLNERLGDLMLKVSDPASSDGAEKAYELALKQSSEPVDRIRIGLKLAQAYASRNEDGKAQAELAALRNSFPVDARRFGVTPAIVPTSMDATPTPEQRKHAVPFDSDSP